MSLRSSLPWPAAQATPTDLNLGRPRSFRLPQRYSDEMIAHAVEEAPNECCGILAGPKHSVRRLYRGINIERSPLRYNIDPKQLLEIHEEIEGKNWGIVGIYHSHTHTEAYPSATDVRLALWPESLYFIVSLEKPGQPALRAFNIRDGQIVERPVRIV